MDLVASPVGHLGTTPAVLEARASVLGFSLGSAVALQYAARHPVQRIILFAPFTSMLDMARLVVGSPLCYLLAHRYDNLATLRTIDAHGQPPLNILHGAQDSLIPHTMGEALAAASPGSQLGASEPESAPILELTRRVCRASRFALLRRER